MCNSMNCFDITKIEVMGLGRQFQPLPISPVLQPLPQLHCPSPDSLQQLIVCLAVRGPELTMGFEGNGHCPGPAGHKVSGASQDATAGSCSAYRHSALGPAPLSVSSNGKSLFPCS